MRASMYDKKVPKWEWLLESGLAPHAGDQEAASTGVQLVKVLGKGA
jgi:hypothetical protein